MSKEYKQLSELGKIVTGKTPSTTNSEYWDGDIPFITPTDINGYDTFYQIQTERSISELGASKQKKTILPPNSICITCIGSTIGKPCVTKVSSITNQQINSIVPNKCNDFRYIYYLIRENLAYLQLIGGGSGSGTPIISKNKFAKFKFLVENNLESQCRIASILSAYDNLIENNSKRIRLLEQMAENLYKEWFVRFRFPGHENVDYEDGLPKGWKIDNLSNEFFTSSGGTPSRSNPDYFRGKTPWIKTGELLGTFILDTEEHITNEAIANSSAKLIPPYSLLIAMYAGANVGNLGINVTTATCNQACCVINSKGDYSLLYLMQFLKTQKAFLQSISFGAAQQNISQDIIKRLKVLYPPKYLCEKYNNYIKPYYLIIEKLLKENDNLSRQRDLLLPRLMSGKLEV